ncbi:MAG: ammonium transporter [Oscillospiraceae bacterium]|nr:ammonium transporter [Oscillospiraceae bacterium]
MTDLMQVMETVNAEIFGIWFLIGAALVFFMQAGFAMVETGFTRAKNAGNIIMKNLMDFCIGTMVFALLGFGLMFGEDIGGFIGVPTFDLFTNYQSFDWSNFVFNLVFCATAATIVSGAMAERTKFLSYCVYSAIISLVIYPVEAHWIWGDGWLSQIGFHDFAGSCAIHLVGGITALIGAKIVGPRIGKFTKDKKPVAIPGHSLTLGALGCFILWFGWYGFNGAAATTAPQLGSVFLTTTIAPAVATVVCMIFTWIKYGKPDVSMCLNASLAGLVGITAGCDVTDAAGSAIIGAVSGLLVIFGVWFLDNVLKIDDPVGAVAVHFFNGVWGTLAVGLFASPDVPENELTGLFYGGDLELLSKQALGVITVGAWTAVTMTIVFLVIKKTIGLRVTRHEEVVGLDLTEHGLTSSYADFIPATHIETTAAGKEKEVANVIPTVSVEKTVPVEHKAGEGFSADGVKMTKVDIITNIERFDALKNALYDIGITGMTVTNTMGCGMQKGAAHYYRGIKVTPQLLPKVKVEVVVCKVPVEEVVTAAKNALYTGNVGDGKIFVYDVENVLKIRTSEEGYDALQDNP